MTKLTLVKFETRTRRWQPPKFGGSEGISEILERRRCKTANFPEVRQRVEEQPLRSEGERPR